MSSSAAVRAGNPARATARNSSTPRSSNSKGNETRARRPGSPSPIAVGRAGGAKAGAGGGRAAVPVPVVVAAASPAAGIEAGSLKWQHPFVDVFRSFHLAEWGVAEKCGDVTAALVRAGWGSLCRRLPWVGGVALCGHPRDPSPSPHPRNLMPT
jgi:hypothetical protein